MATIVNEMNATQPPDRADPRMLLRMLWRWKLLFLAIVVAAPTIAYFIVKNKPRIYESSALVSVQSAALPGGNGTGTTNIAAIARIVTTSSVENIAAKLLNPPASPGSLAGSVSATSDIATNFITITADARSPQRAAAIANAFAAALGTNRTNAAIADINTQIATVQRQLAGVPLGAAGQIQRQQLQQQLAQLRAARGSQSGNTSVVQAATPNPTAVSPHIRRTVELGLVIGLLLAIGAVALAENSDRRLRSPDDLEEVTRLPLLSAVPAAAFSAPMDSTGNEEEAFQMLRAALTYFNIDRRLSTVVITSAGQKDGKTTVAIRLALATARAGKRVLLVDADLRRAQVTERLGLVPSDGLGAVLVGETSLASALLQYPVEATKGGHLEILPAGRHAPPNPSELLSSQEMRNLLKELELRADLVIIDTPAALAVSDTMPLLTLASGVVLIARSNRSTRDSIKRLQRVITTAGGTIVGVVATASGSGLGYDSYGYGYTANGAGGAMRKKRWLRRQKRDAQSVPESRDSDLAPVPTELSDV